MSGVCEGERYRIVSGVRQENIMFPWLFNGCCEEGGEDGDGKEVSEIPGGGERVEIIADNLVRSGKSEEDVRAMVRRCAEVCRRRALKINEGKSKMIEMNGEEGLEYAEFV